MKLMNYLVTKTKKRVVNLKLKLLKNFWIDEFIALRSKMYAFKCGDDSKIILKGICKSQSNHIKFEECKKCLDGKDYQNECDKEIVRSIDREMHLQKVKSSTLLSFDDKRCYKNGTESKHCN